MTNSEIQVACDQLEDLLDKEQLALKTGDIDRVYRLSQQKKFLIDELSSVQAGSQFDVIPLQQKILRNRDLIENALHGVQSVIRQIADLKEAQNTLSTYDRLGKRQSLDTKTASQDIKRI